MNLLAFFISWTGAMSVLLLVLTAAFFLIQRNVSSASTRYLWQRTLLGILPFLAMVAWIPETQQDVTQPAHISALSQTYQSGPVTILEGAENISWLPEMVAIYVTGLLVFLLWTFRQYWSLNQIIARSKPHQDPQQTHLYLTDQSLPPMSCGILQGRIILKREVYESLSRDQLDMIFKHENIHIRRGDNLFLLIANLASALFWFHPGWWFIRRMTMEDMELSCDEQVLKSEVKPFDYGQLLVVLAQHLTPVARPVIGGTYFNNSFLLRRVKAMKQGSKGMTKTGGFVLALILAGLGGASWSLAQASIHEDIAPLIVDSESEDADVGLRFNLRMELTENRVQEIRIRANLNYDEEKTLDLDGKTLSFVVEEGDEFHTITFELGDDEGNAMRWRLRGNFGDEEEIELRYPDAPMEIELININMALSEPFPAS